MNTTHEYTNEQIQAAIDAAFITQKHSEGWNLVTRSTSVHWDVESPNRLAIARAFLATLPKPPAEASADLEQPKPADDGPPWIPHDGGPCPLKNEEVEEWEMQFRNDVEHTTKDRPSKHDWDHTQDDEDIIAYRVHKWKSGHGPQSAKPEPAPDTFEAHGQVWTRHTPGDPCPVDGEAKVEYLMRHPSKICQDAAKLLRWGQKPYGTREEEIIGWRYADEPAALEPHHGWPMDDLLKSMDRPKAAQPTQSQQAWTPRPGDVVRLKSGGPEMTVRYFSGESVVVGWFDGSGLQFGALLPRSLTPAKEDRP